MFQGKQAARVQALRGWWLVGLLWGLSVACNRPAAVISPPIETALAEPLGAFQTPSPAPSATPLLTVLVPSPPLPTPTPTATPPPPPEVPRVEIEPPQVKQGGVVVLRVSTALEIKLAGTFGGQTWEFLRNGKEYWSLLGIAPWTQPGPRPLNVTATDGLGWQSKARVFLDVLPTAFPVEHIEVATDKVGLLNQELLDAERIALEELVSRRRLKKLWQGLFVMPTEAETSSAFGTRRSFTGGVLLGPHLGMDIDASLGAMVVAANDGVVVFAKPLAVRGNVVIIDHGVGVYTGYFHLSQIDAVEGKEVHKGERIGLVGASGLVTGPHLHWEMRVGGVPVDPLEWTRRTFP